MNEPTIEQDCIFEFQGHKYKSGGAFISDTHLIAYMDSDGKTVKTWHGEIIGTSTLRARWSTPRSFISSHMTQRLVTLSDGRRYTGRTAGASMVFHGKRTK